ncbi:MAG: helix-turn-helix domain-containing protein [Methanomassiliicoccus sp.]|nr:helix-turn-helix domain-containing protein [Methanomassiliicoccus sp.]
MADIIHQLNDLGFGKYEAMILVALMKMGEGTVSEISEVSGVPRSRTYDVLKGMTEKGYVFVSVGTPLAYQVVEPKKIQYLIDERLGAIENAVLEELSRLRDQSSINNAPMTSINGEWSIRQKTKEVLEGAHTEAIIFSRRHTSIRDYTKDIIEASEKIKVTCIFGEGAPQVCGQLGKVCIMEPIDKSSKEMKLIRSGFRVNDRSHTKYITEVMIHTDDNRSILIYSVNKVKSAVLSTLPFITYMHHLMLKEALNSCRVIGERLPSYQ